MAARPGEESVATLFGDVHYFYGPAEIKPRHHRFDKGSYVYLFENANERRCRIEVANNPGADDQDAFEGFLDQTRLQYSYKHSCMVTLTVAENVDVSEWHLPTYDPRNENIYHYKLHSLDIYFRTQQDALTFVNGVRMVIQPSQVEVLDEPGPPPQPAPMSAVVQKLEHVAISDPQYGTSGPSTQGSSHSFAPPPKGPPPGTQATQPEPAQFVPMAYNPAAPAAPESINHREKTPPPDEDPLNPLAVAVAYDYQRQPFTPGMPPPSQFPPGGMTSPGLPPPHFGGATHPGLQRATTMPVQGNLPNTYGTSFPGPPASQPPPQQAVAQPPGQPTPAGPNPGGYSYAQQPQANPGAVDYSIHQQVYRPTQVEMTNPDNHSYAPKTEVRGRLEENAGRLERGVTGMFKKFEKKFG